MLTVFISLCRMALSLSVDITEPVLFASCSPPSQLLSHTTEKSPKTRAALPVLFIFWSLTLVCVWYGMPESVLNSVDIVNIAHVQ